jgi:transposase
MKKTSTVRVNGNMIFKGHKLTIGVDLGDHWSCYCVLDEAGKIILEQKVATTPEAMKQAFAKIPQSLIVMETGTHSPWVSRLLTELGAQSDRGARTKGAIDHQEQSKRRSTRCADTGTAGTNRCRAVGAGAASQCASANPPDGDPGAGRTGACSDGLGERGTRVGEVLWAAATQVWHAAGEPGAGRGIARGVARGSGAMLREVLEPLLKEIESLNERIQEYEVRVEKIAKESYPQAELLKQVKGVGTQIALTYVLTLDDPHRFPKSREVGGFLGLCPGRRDSGESQPQMRISKEGDRYLRTMLVQGAHYILGPFGADSDLRRWGLKLAARGGKNAKKRAVVAVARKLAVLLHRLWVSGEAYEPLRNSQQAMRVAA